MTTSGERLMELPVSHPAHAGPAQGADEPENEQNHEDEAQDASEPAPAVAAVAVVAAAAAQQHDQQDDDQYRRHRSDLVVRDVMSAGSPRTVWQLVGVFFSEDGQAVGLTQINEKSGSGPKTSRRDNARSL